MSQQINKVGLIINSSAPEWVSCSSILNNLITAYNLSGDKIETLPMDQNSTEGEIVFLANQIKDRNLTHIVFADHRFLPLTLLHQLHHISKSLPTIVIHIYGDFFLNSYLWNSEEEILKKYRILFICASSAQANFVRQFIASSDNFVATIPFPVDACFAYDNESRVSARKKYDLPSNEIVISYSGRISLQKNIMDLLSTFKFLADVMPNIRLLIAGSFDDIGIPYIGLGRFPLTMETEFYEFIDKLPGHIRDRITYCGNLNKTELIDFYLASDFFISLSTHNDEDFGMSPAEAISTGLPTILSNWGGYADFKLNFPREVQLIDVTFSPLRIRPGSLPKKEILAFLMNNLLQSEGARAIFSQRVQNLYTPSSVAQTLKENLDREYATFSGFNDLFKSVAIKSIKMGPFQSKSNEYDEIYKSIYRPYFNGGLK